MRPLLGGVAFGFRGEHPRRPYGYLSELKDNTTGTVYWKANARDAELHLLGQTAGNGVVTTQAFDPATGRVQTIRAGAANAVANFSYGFDTLGNLTSRGDANAALAETFGYDALSRLTGVTTNGTPRSATFDAEGDILTKSDVGTYSYGAGAGPHAVTSVAGTVNGVVNPTFAYDANGNMTSGAGRTYAYTSFNMAASVTTGAASAAFTYDADHGRVVQAATAGTTYYLNDAASGAMSELYNPGHVWRDYIWADGRLVLVRTLTGTTATFQYLTTDHLGSVTVIADQTGAVLQRLSYDAWGARRNPDGTPPTSPIVGQTTRGFTGQEAMDALGLIDFNARLYDPQLARFLAADPTISNAYLGQLLDRYGYVGNNPLSLTDPTGLCFITCDPVFRAVIAFVVVFILEQPQFLPALEGTTLTASLTASEVSALNAGILGGVAGLITTGNLKGALLSAGEAVAFSGVGDLLGVDKLTGPAQTAATFVAHGAVGGLFTVAGGGKFGSGFLAAGVGSLGDSSYTKVGSLHFVEASAEHAILGGVGSVLGGGKFENGAITGAFGYLFNRLARDPRGQTGSNKGAFGDCPSGTECLSYETVAGGPSEGSWDIHWQLSLPPTQGGLIVQYVTFTSTSDSGPASYSYYLEAWPVGPGQNVTNLFLNGGPYDDEFGGPPGTIITGSARFYAGEKLPSSFIANNPATYAHILPSTTENPHLPDTNATPPVTRIWSH